jgi:hypothetical protein
MNVRIALQLSAALSLIGCSDAAPSNANATPTVAAAKLGDTSETWRISSDGIGPLKLGAKLVEPEGGFEETYRTSFYGDKQPLEGFAFSEPPVLAVFKDGPFSAWGANNVGRKPPEAIQTRAVALARAKRFKVEMLVTTDPRPETTAGVSVGDDYATFARAYPRAPAPEAFVGLWEQPSCMVSHGTIWFFFDRCDDADRAKIIRIAVRTDGSQV